MYIVASNSGTTFNEVTNYQGSIFISSSGSQYNFMSYLYYVITTITGGISWTKVSYPQGHMFSITSSTSGQYVSAIQCSYYLLGCYLYYSQNFGGTFALISSFNGTLNQLNLTIDNSGHYLNNIKLTIDSTGQYLAAAVSLSTLMLPGGSERPGFIYISTSAGSNWSKVDAPSLFWTKIITTSSGSLVSAVATNCCGYLHGSGGVYIWDISTTAVPTPSPVIVTQPTTVGVTTTTVSSSNRSSTDLAVILIAVVVVLFVALFISILIYYRSKQKKTSDDISSTYKNIALITLSESNSNINENDTNRNVTTNNKKSNIAYV